MRFFILTFLLTACSGSSSPTEGFDSEPDAGLANVDAPVEEDPGACLVDHPQAQALFEETVSQIRAAQRRLDEAPVDLSDWVWVSAELDFMEATDQAVRLAYYVPHEECWPAEEMDCAHSALLPLFEEVDAHNRERIVELLGIYEWITISGFGEEPDRQAWLIVQHSDLALQLEVLPILERLYPRGETRPANYADLYDRVAMQQERPQRYGTQVRCVDGAVAAYDLEDPERVDELRAEVGLGPLNE